MPTTRQAGIGGDCLGRGTPCSMAMEPTAAPSSSLPGARRSSAPDIHALPAGTNVAGQTKKMGKSPDLAGRHLPEAVFLKYEIESAIYGDSQESLFPGSTVSGSTPGGQRRHQHSRFRSSLRHLRPHDSYLNSRYGMDSVLYSNQCPMPP